MYLKQIDYTPDKRLEEVSKKLNESFLKLLEGRKIEEEKFLIKVMKDHDIHMCEIQQGKYRLITGTQRFKHHDYRDYSIYSLYTPEGEPIFHIWPGETKIEPTCFTVIFELEWIKCLNK